jgi:ribonuclease HII
MIIATFTQEENLLASGFDFVLGIDEAGRGPLAGSVVASVATLKNFSSVDLADKKWNLIRDSKAVTEKQREAMLDFIYEHFYVGVGICDHNTIDRINILEASFLAMKKAVTDFQNKQKEILKNKRCIVLVDGNKIIPSFSLEQVAIISGDKLVKSIAAASIVAKVTRDRMICEADKLYPEYGFSSHKGYGTKKHFEALKKFGPCEIHRKTFAPVKNMLREN